jgi:long-chain acyl-CoA synthetase
VAGADRRLAGGAVLTAAAPRTLVELLAASVAAYGPRPLFVTRDEDGRWAELSYTAFAAEVDQLRGGLASLGVGPGDAVGIIADNGVPWAAAAYASYGLGAAFVPMYPSQRPEEWAFIARDSGIKVLLAATAPDGAGQGEVFRRVAGLPGEIPTLAAVVLIDGDGAALTYPRLLATGAGHPAPVQAPAPGDTACLLYTSGTTGEPKGVILSHANVVSNVQALSAAIPLSAELRTVSFLPWAHAFGHTVELHTLVAAGASMAIAGGVDRLVERFGEVRPSALVAVPRVFARIYAAVTAAMARKPAPVRWLFRQGLKASGRRSAGEPLGLGQRLLLWLAGGLVFAPIRARFGGRLRFSVSGAASLAREAAELMDALGITIYEGYGLTETSPVVSANVPGARKLGSVGRPLPGVRVVIDRAAGGEGGDGEIVVHGPNVMQGYHRRPEETRAALTPDGGLRTGDLGHLDQDGYLFITGRLKEQYKLENGKYVVPGPYEERLKLSPFIASVMVHGDGRPHNVALVVPAAEALRAWAAAEGLGGRGYPELLQHPRTRQLIAAEIDRLSSQVRRYERVAAFALLAEDFTQEAGTLTPSLKVRRQAVLARWGAEVERLYARAEV